MGVIAGASCKGKNGERESSGPDSQSASSQDKSRVIVCRRPESFKLGEQPGKSSVKKLLQSALEGFYDNRLPEDAIAEKFSPGDKVGIKVNCLSGKSMSTHRELAFALAELLVDAGVKADNITIWDRKDKDLTGAGYTLNRGRGIKVTGVDADGYSDELTAHRSIGSFMARILEKSDKIINLPVLKDHGIVGVTLGMKNFFGAIHNPNKYHPNAGDPYVADLYSHPLIKDKVKLTIIDGITGQYEGGPPPMPQWQWNFGGLIIGSDPIAVDRAGFDIIESKRREMGIKSLQEAGRYPEYLRTAEKLRLGVFDNNQIEIIEA